MKSSMKIALAAIAVSSVLSLSAQAVEKNITVTASIDPALNLLQADGTELPTTVSMAYNPSNGLTPVTISTKIYSNTATKDVSISTLGSPVLTNTVDSAQTIPLVVNYNGKPLSTTATTLTAASVFVDNSGASVSMPLVIAATNTGHASWTQGTYQGVVSLLLQQPTP
ncbi:hypothetical protein AV650_08240 [Serratia fonticola]|nr:hypothetical protein AV650_08240 [Serratia fonticola]